MKTELVFHVLVVSELASLEYVRGEVSSDTLGGTETPLGCR